MLTQGCLGVLIVALLFGMLDGIDGRPGSQKMIPLG